MDQPEVSSTEAQVTQEPSQTPVEAVLESQLPSEGTDAPPSGEGDTAKPEAIPEYTPDFKYKAWGQEKELDERVRGFIKNQEDEKYFKDLFSMKDGVEPLKQQREQLRSSNETYRNEIQKVLTAADKGDYKSVFASIGVQAVPENLGRILEGLGFNDEAIIQHAYKLALLTPDQKAAYAREQQLEKQSREMQMTAAQYQEQLQSMQVQQRTQELTQALSSPEVAPIVQAFDQSHGQGAFWEEVKNRGRMHYHVSGVDKPVGEVVQEVMRLVRFAQPQAPAPQPQASVQTQRPTPDSVPVIPNTGGGQASPTVRQIDSMDALRAEANKKRY